MIVGPLRLGDISASDLRDVPADVGVRFLRTSANSTPAEREGPRILRAHSGGLASVSPRVAVDGAITQSSVSATVPALLTISPTPTGLRVPELALELTAPAAAAATLRAAVTVALAAGVPFSERVFERPVRLVLEVPSAGTVAGTSAMSEPWMADVARAVLDSGAIRREARAATLLSRSGVESPWLPLARAATGEVLAAAASTRSTRDAQKRPALVVRVRASAESALWPLLLHRILTSRFDHEPIAAPERLPIPDAQLASWSRPAGDFEIDAARQRSTSDRRWAWSLVLAGLALEALVSRTRKSASSEGANRDRAA